MSLNAMNAVVDTYTAYTAATDKSKETRKETAAAQKTQTAAQSQEAEESGAVYEKSSGEKKATYSINQMSEEKRTALVEQMKADQQNRQQQLLDLVKKTLSEQANAFTEADSVWKLFANGDVTVSEAARKQAEEEISEDGYYGVKQTSQRLFDFASALAGDDVDKMKAMQKAMAKGYDQATGAWGKELPGICKDTIDAANQLFEDYYKSKEQI